MSSRQILSKVFLKQKSAFLRPSSSYVRPRVSFNTPFATRDYTTSLKIVNYDDIKQLIEKDDNDYVLLDVREPKEVEGGYIPTAKNVPLKQFHFAWDLVENDFKENYGFEKPKKNEKMITYCLKGIRSTMAAEHLKKIGYLNVENYYGSYDDYMKKSKGGSS